LRISGLIKLATGRGVLAATIAALAASGVGVAMAAIPSDGQIDGCYSKVRGTLRVIDRENGKKCSAKREIPIAWNQTGPAGAPGAPGPQGETGPQGPQGPAGTVDTSNFYDKTSSDERFLGGNGHAVANAVSLPVSDDPTSIPMSSVLGIGPSENQLTLDAGCNSAHPTDFIRFTNRTAAAMNFFYESGDENPSYHTLAPGGDVVFPTLKAGDSLHIQAQANGFGVVTIEVATVHRADDCHVQAQALLTSSAPTTTPTPPPISTPGEEEQKEFDVILESDGGKKIQVIKVVRELTGLGLMEAKNTVEAAPVAILERVNKQAAENAKAKLEAEGAKVTIR
jgi:large subunit ribosomal protein L7/L12